MSNARTLRAPFFEIGPKTFLRRAELLSIAKSAESASIEFDVAVILTAPVLDLEHMKLAAPDLWLFAQHMDADRPGRSSGALVPEALRDVGADGVMLNHAEHPLDFATLRRTLERAQEVGLLSLVCANSPDEARRIARLGPTIILVEPPELIGTRTGGSRPDIRLTDDDIASIDPTILVMHGGGIGSVEHVAELIGCGASGTGSTSAIIDAPDPSTIAYDMIRTVREAWDRRENDQPMEAR
jgi:triosephosphate isomerase (TIM)